ncbi:MAG: HsdM family class I SAM-dependent methyltransferase [Candidatus Hodarchaeales archaeon]|jgi:methylase of polypeptide subunit release factors
MTRAGQGQYNRDGDNKLDELPTGKLLKFFGPGSQLEQVALATLQDKLINARNPVTRTLFTDWLSTFPRAPGSAGEQESGAPVSMINTPGNNNLEWLFCIQTYFALVVKLLAAELACLLGSHNNPKSHALELEELRMSGNDKFKRCLKELESGNLFYKRLGIINFTEGCHHFSWYLEELDEELTGLIIAIANQIAKHELITIWFDPERVTDLLKPLYQKLIPGQSRHDLGEYYTPDWLARFLLDKIDYSAKAFEKLVNETGESERPLELRLLDPACGSGTFLVEVLRRMRQHVEKYGLMDKLAERAFENIVGFDLNPLATLAARTNYLLLVVDVLPQDVPVEIPVYIADAITLPAKKAIKGENSDFERLEPFDFIAGNPPWILWDNLPMEYREKTREAWKEHGLSALTQGTKRQLALKKDISTLFTQACADKYLADRGKLGFLMTRSAFKTKGGGEGFRRFKLKNTFLKVQEVHDMIEVQPFENISNRTALVVMEKGKKTTYPVKYFHWKKEQRLDRDDSLETVLAKTRQVELVAIPSDPNNELSPWMTIPEKAIGVITKARGKSSYSAKAGIYSGGANGVYWLEIIAMKGQSKRKLKVDQRLGELLGVKEGEISVKVLLVKNVTRGMKRKVKEVTTIIEDFFVYPLLKSRNVKKWKIDGYRYALQMQNPVRRIGYEEEWVKNSFPDTHEYLKSFKDVLTSRKSKYIRNMMKKGAFYSMIDVGELTYAPYKVTWKQMGKELSACVVTTVKDRYLGEKLLLPEHVLAFVGTESEDEAHYICAILNSGITGSILGSISSGTKSFGTPKMIEDTVRIPRYANGNVLHEKLAGLSRKAHATTSREGDMLKIEKEIDKTVAKLHGLTEEELQVLNEIS